MYEDRNGCAATLPARSSPALADYWALTKPDINFLIAIVTFAGFYPGFPAGLHGFPLLLSINTIPVRGLVLGVEAAHQAHPDKPILLDGITSALFNDAISQSAFYPLAIDDVYLTPGSELKSTPPPMPATSAIRPSATGSSNLPPPCTPLSTNRLWYIILLAIISAT